MAIRAKQNTWGVKKCKANLEEPCSERLRALTSTKAKKSVIESMTSSSTIICLGQEAQVAIYFGLVLFTPQLFFC